MAFPNVERGPDLPQPSQQVGRVLPGDLGDHGGLETETAKRASHVVCDTPRHLPGAARTDADVIPCDGPDDADVEHTTP